MARSTAHGVAPVIQLNQQGNDVLIPVKVIPGASRDRIVGELDGALKVSVSAAPEKGAANKALCSLIARTIGLRTSQVTVEAGRTSPRKTLRVRDVPVEQVRAILPSS